MDIINHLMAGAAARAAVLARPLVTLSYAQSLDGCLSARRGQGMAISGAETRLLTHRLRAANDAILVGIGTVLADDPRLTARLVEGPHPRPVVLDSQLRIPLTARLLAQAVRPGLIFCSDGVSQARIQAVRDLGAQVIALDGDADGRLNLRSVQACLWNLGVQTLMVEGGARVITAFLAGRLADQAMVTVAPVWLGGAAAVEGHLGSSGLYPVIQAAGAEPFGRDWVVWGKIGEDHYAATGSVFHSTPPG